MARDLPEVVGAVGHLPGCTFLTDDDVSAVVVAVAPAPEPGEGAQPRSGTIDAAALYRVDLAEMAERHRLEGHAGEVAVVDLPRPHRGATESFPWAGLPPRVVLLGVGDGSPADLRRAGAALARRTAGLDRVVSVATAGAGSEAVRAFVEGYLLAAYRPERWSAEPDSRPAPAVQLVLLDPAGDAEPVLERARRAARATWLARDLTATPSNVKDPAWLAGRAQALADDAGLDVRVLGPAELAAQGFGGILAVGGGSSRPPRLVTVTHDPAPGGGAPRHVVVVGKGITFDTGGLSLKPRASMVPMKTDMAGAAVALAVVLGAAAAGSAHRVTAVLPLAENHLGGASYRPGDVLHVHGGTTVEVANTDAEGRLVLADALDYAVRELAPDVLVDVATLTGAAAVGLGRGHAALYATDEALAAVLEGAAVRSGEPVWRMPLVADYASALRSDLADLRHVPADPPGGGGSITAALFLREFTGAVPWAHLDIAGPARAAVSRHEVVEGATGFGARLLLEALDVL